LVALTLKQDKVALGHGSRKVDTHLPTVQLLTDELSMWASFAQGLLQVDGSGLFNDGLLIC